MRFEEAYSSVLVTKEQAENEIKKHNLTLADFIADKGDREHYKGFEVLRWLGY